MSSVDLKLVRDIFARLFVIAVQQKINLYVFTLTLGCSKLVKKIDNDDYDIYFNKPLTELFSLTTGYEIYSEESYGVYNDAYWCGAMYFDIYQKTHKPFPYLFLKLPLYKMLDIYSIYHEMDFSALLEYFHRLEQEKTILRLLCENRAYSLPRLSKETGINVNTLAKYYISDDALYSASFQNIMKISKVIGITPNLFIQSVK